MKNITFPVLFGLMLVGCMAVPVSPSAPVYYAPASSMGVYVPPAPVYYSPTYYYTPIVPLYWGPSYYYRGGGFYGGHRHRR